MEALDLQPLPPRGKETLHLMRLKAGDELLCHCVSQAVWGLNTHWAGNHSEPCFKDKKKCDGCKKGLPHRWKGFLHVIRCSDRKEFFVELTSTATALLHDQVPDREQLRGFRLKIYRGRGGNNSRLKAELYGDKSLDLRLPEPRDPLPTLQKIWRVQKGLDNQPNNV